MTKSVVETQIHHINQANGDAYQVFIGVTPDINNPSADPDGTQYFFYMKNTNDHDLVINQIRIWVESVEYIDMYFKTEGSPIGGSNLTPVNMNLGSGITAVGTFQQGTNLTGLSGGIFYDRLRIPADDNDHLLQWPSMIIISKNEVMAFQAGNGGVRIEMSIALYHESM